MRKLMWSMLGAAGLLAALAGTARAQEETKRVYNGKRWEWVAVKADEKPTTLLVALAPGEEKEGDIPGTTTVGKNTVLVYFRRVPIPAAEVAKGHTCSERVTTVLKHLEVRHFCRVDGAEKPCPGMTKAGECLAVVK